jgi:hypothetical protein
MYPAKPSQLGPPTGEDPPDDVPELEPPPSPPAPESAALPPLADPVPPPELDPPLPEPELTFEPAPELDDPPEPDVVLDEPDDEALAPSLPPDEEPPVPMEPLEGVFGLLPHAASTIHGDSRIDCKPQRKIFTTDPSRLLASSGTKVFEAVDLIVTRA